MTSLAKPQALARPPSTRADLPRSAFTTHVAWTQTFSVSDGTSSLKLHNFSALIPPGLNTPGGNRCSARSVLRQGCLRCTHSPPPAPRFVPPPQRGQEPEQTGAALGEGSLVLGEAEGRTRRHGAAGSPPGPAAAPHAASPLTSPQRPPF